MTQRPCHRQNIAMRHLSFSSARIGRTSVIFINAFFQHPIAGFRIISAGAQPQQAASGPLQGISTIAAPIASMIFRGPTTNNPVSATLQASCTVTIVDRVATISSLSASGLHLFDPVQIRFDHRADLGRMPVRIARVFGPGEREMANLARTFGILQHGKGGG